MKAVPYLWPLAPFALVASLLVMLPLGPIAILSIPYYAIFPDRHLHKYDVEGTEQQRKRMVQWRSVYSRMSFVQRLVRAMTHVKRRFR